ncbi:hypothetical protein P8C59_008502 [Phyllachora maydis]|uniref:Autophagy protein 5 n=1 Tax=Phyllachora maydis TaxID=1825666 RepID=A0AAD9MF93_9PEZI|nr:hypothetical protein P8C59_008502 [Phyllachora maydis]
MSAGAPPPSPSVAQTLWAQRVPVYVTHRARRTDDAAPFVASVPRFGYLALLLPRLRAFFGAACSTFHHELVPLRALPVGLLLDLYRPALPWRLEVAAADDDADGPAPDVADVFMNAAKEADFVRNGHAKQIMGLSKAKTTALWHAVRDGDGAAFARLHAGLLDAPAPLKKVPLRLYVPHAAAGAYRVVQAPVAAAPPQKTLGQALAALLPGLFPAAGAHVLMHGAPVPLAAPLEELMREAAFPDGWLCLTVVLVT